MNKIFSSVQGNRPKLNRFDCSYTNTTSMCFGYLYPVQCDEVFPGDVWKMKAFCHAELQPLRAPLMTDLQLFAHTFFVPYRLLYGFDDDGNNIWELFITGGKSGTYDTPLPSWKPTGVTSVGFSSKLIWDYIGNPMSLSVTTDGDGNTVNTWTPICPTDLLVSIAPKYAYNLIYNSFYRDEDLIDEVDLTSEVLQRVSFKKDYFTSALIQQQRGITPALPVDLSGELPVNFTVNAGTAESFQVSGFPYGKILPIVNDHTKLGISASSNASVSSTSEISSESSASISGYVDAGNINSTTFDVSQLRLAFSIQRLLELSMRSGYRYTEFLGAHFGVSPTDARLDRPEYIGGSIMPVSVSPLVQTSSTDVTSPQGNKSGIGHIDRIDRIGNYRVLEYGLIMTLVSVRPKPVYTQGINRQWLRQDRYAYYSPEFAYLSEQGVYNAELYVDPTEVNPVTGEYVDGEIFGYQAHWNELRCKNNLVSGSMREQFDYWTLARKFASRPALNQDFIEIVDSDFNHIFAVQDEDCLLVSWSNIIDAYRPIPAFGTPGLVDHVYGGM